MLLETKVTEKRLRNRIISKKLIQKGTNKFKNNISIKYDLAPEQVESKCFQSEQFREGYNLHRLQKVKQDTDRGERSDKNNYMKQTKKLRALLDFGELVYVLAERLKKKDPPGKIYKISTENEPFVIKSQVFTIPKRVVFNNGFYNY